MVFGKKLIYRSIIVALDVLIHPWLIFAQPVVPGFIVETYAQQSDFYPVNLSFDSTGVLYASTAEGTASIWRIGAGGSPLERFGVPIYDADAVAIDENGDRERDNYRSGRQRRRIRPYRKQL